MSNRNDYQKIVGLWQRRLFNGQHESNGPYALFKLVYNKKLFWAEHPGNNPPYISGAITNYYELPQATKGKFKTTTGPQTWNYALDQNRGFKSLYRPRPGYPNPPLLNEMRLWTPGIDQLYAFVAVCPTGNVDPFIQDIISINVEP